VSRAVCAEARKAGEFGFARRLIDGFDDVPLAILKYLLAIRRGCGVNFVEIWNHALLIVAVAVASPTVVFVPLALQLCDAQHLSGVGAPGVPVVHAGGFWASWYKLLPAGPLLGLEILDRFAE
jgi:hypothetical protein